MMPSPVGYQAAEKKKPTGLLAELILLLPGLLWKTLSGESELKLLPAQIGSMGRGVLGCSHRIPPQESLLVEPEMR